MNAVNRSKNQECVIPLSYRLHSFCQFSWGKVRWVARHPQCWELPPLPVAFAGILWWRAAGIASRHHPINVFCPFISINNNFGHGEEVQARKTPTTPPFEDISSATTNKDWVVNESLFVPATQERHIRLRESVRPSSFGHCRCWVVDGFNHGSNKRQLAGGIVFKPVQNTKGSVTDVDSVPVRRKAEMARPRSSNSSLQSWCAFVHLIARDKICGSIPLMMID